MQQARAYTERAIGHFLPLPFVSVARNETNVDGRREPVITRNVRTRAGLSVADHLNVLLQVESESEAAAVAAIAVLTAPLSLEGGLAAELQPANLVQRVFSLFRNVRPGSDLSHFQVNNIYSSGVATRGLAGTWPPRDFLTSLVIFYHLSLTCRSLGTLIRLSFY